MASLNKANCLEPRTFVVIKDQIHARTTMPNPIRGRIGSRDSPRAGGAPGPPSRRCWEMILGNLRNTTPQQTKRVGGDLTILELCSRVVGLVPGNPGQPKIPIPFVLKGLVIREAAPAGGEFSRLAGVRIILAN